MPDQAAIRDTIDQYRKLFSSGDRDGWLALFADGATMEDPVGTPLKNGKEEIGAFYEQSRSAAEAVELRGIGVDIVVGDQASFAMEIRATVGGAVMTLPAIDVMTFDDDARITSQRAFVDFSQMKPAEG